MNALFIFALSGFIAKMMGFIKMPAASAVAAEAAAQAAPSVSLKAWLYAPLKALPLEPVQASLLWALLFNAVMFIVAWTMWKKRWFIKA
jgi:predicted acyltransferase